MEDYYLATDGPKIEGESQKQGHEKEIEVVSWSWGGSNDGSFASGSGGGTGKYSSHDLTVNIPISKASGKLLQNCAKGTHIDKAILSCRKSGGDTKPYDFLKITLEHCLISSFNTSGAQGSDHMIDSITINFAKVTYEYFAQDAAKGTVSSTGSISHDHAKAVTA
jgi:type VI secretion system secreted protein Hcp